MSNLFYTLNTYLLRIIYILKTKPTYIFFMKRKLIKFFAIFLLFTTALSGLGFFVYYITKPATPINSINMTIVIDAGHGAEDGGCVGTSTGIKESDLNLIYAKKIGSLLNSLGVKVVYTRENDEPLYTAGAKDKKLADMQKRQQIIDACAPQAVISIHMNKFSLPSSCGAQVFYNDENDYGKVLATSIRDELLKYIDSARELVLPGDYFMVNCSNAASVIVECGFLSNPQEELLLQDEEYQNKLSYTIFLGIVKYLNIKNN